MIRKKIRSPAGGSGRELVKVKFYRFPGVLPSFPKEKARSLPSAHPLPKEAIELHRFRREVIPGKEAVAYVKLASSSFLSSDPLISTLLQKIKKADKGKGKGDASEHGRGSVVGSVMGKAGGWGGGGKGGLSLPEFQLQLRCADGPCPLLQWRLGGVGPGVYSYG